MTRYPRYLLFAFITLFVAACGGKPEAAPPVEEDAPVAARVFFMQPTDAAVLPPTSQVVMGYEGLIVQPAGEVVEGAGHMHILVDTGFIPAGQVIPQDDQHLHFGTGAVEAELTLTPGLHTLRLQFADGTHTALEGDAYRDEIQVTVQ